MSNAIRRSARIIQLPGIHLQNVGVGHHIEIAKGGILDHTCVMHARKDGAFVFRQLTFKGEPILASTEMASGAP